MKIINRLFNRQSKIEKSKNKDPKSVYVMSQWELMWRKFRKHKLANISAVVLIFIYLLALFAPFLAPYDKMDNNAMYIYAQPQIPRFWDENGFSWHPFIYEYERKIDPVSFRRTYEINKEKRIPIHFFVEGSEYSFFGLKSNLHLFGTDHRQPVFVLGSDRLGRDMFSRILYGARISTTIGLVGVAISFVLGILIGGFSGLMGGAVDNIIQRLIELIKSIPGLPLWMALSAAVPVQWDPIMVYFMITVILSIIGWTGLARVVRSKFISMREEDFVVAARLVGASETRVVFRHMLPSFLSHIIASLTLSIPGMILGETSLSFLGIGLRPPVVSWGVLMKEAQNIATVANAPWLLLPGVAVIITVLAFNFLGDGLRDAADPYSK